VRNFPGRRDRHCHCCGRSEPALIHNCHYLIYGLSMGTPVVSQLRGGRRKKPGGQAINSLIGVIIALLVGLVGELDRGRRFSRVEDEVPSNGSVCPPLALFPLPWASPFSPALTGVGRYTDTDERGSSPIFACSICLPVNLWKLGDAATGSDGARLP
jgi:hypothetical protein